MSNCKQRRSIEVDEASFKTVLMGIAEGWNKGDATLAIMHFDEEIVYEEPPSTQLHKGIGELFEFFGGEDGHATPMKMAWHTFAFNKSEQLGFGEYTFEMNNRYHGIVVMKFKNGKIIRWREYQYKSDLHWKDFSRESTFENVD